VGKSILIKRITKEFPAEFGFSVSHTTRDPRPGEVDGVDYHYVSKEHMEEAILRNEFLEYARVHGNIYGTSKSAVEDVAAANQICILDIDVQGVEQCQSLQLDVGSYIFISAPSLEEMERRLRGRGTETEEKIMLRVKNASTELEAAKSMHFDVRLVNDDVDAAHEELRSALLPLIEACQR
jgi:guanylate kinase